MAIVCDGHGGERYFRSQIGSELAVKITKEAILNFVETVPESIYSNRIGKPIFNGLPFTQYSADAPSVVQPKNQKQAKNVHEALTGLFSSIISQWNIRITEDAMNNDLNEWELEHVEQKYIDEFRANRNNETATFEKTYGCTLMVYVQTQDYWFAFHLGDGKFLSMTISEGKPVFSQPIPWDEKCFLNRTTSMCDSQAIEEFRYCYQGDGNFPTAVFLGSDGMDDSYGDGDNLTGFYIQLYKLIAKKGHNIALKELKASLPKISQKGSKDDMSVVCIYNDMKLSENALALIEYQIEKTESQREDIEQKIAQLQEKIEKFGNPETLSKSKQIDLLYAEKDLDKAQTLKRKLWSQSLNLRKEAKLFAGMNKEHNQK
jgi:hypothetical protein